MSQFSISGAASGIDTASIINSLVSVQQNQQRLLQTQQSTQQQASSALGSLITTLNTLGTQAGKLATTANWHGSSAATTSSNVTATATGSAAQSLTFDVTSVAAAHSLVSAGTVSSLGSQVAAPGSITVTHPDGSTASVDVGSGTLSDVVAGINASSTGLRAAAVQTGTGQYRLQVTSAATGAASSFSLAGLTGFSGTNVLAQGTDAQITIGTDVNTQYTATSSSNTFDKVLPGLSFTVSKLESGVTVSSKVDGSSVATDIQALVTTANSLLSSISTNTAWNATKKSGGPLVGDAAVRSLQQRVLTLVSGAGAPGVSVTRDGTLSFDSAAFTTAFAKDPAAVAATFGATGAFSAANGVTGSVRYSSATSTTRAGTYAVGVTQAAAREQWDVDATNGLAGTTISLTRGATTSSYIVGATDTMDDIAAALNSNAASSGLGLSASVGGSGLLLTAGSVGAAAAFSVSVDSLAQSRLTAGADVVGTIDGQTGTGTGSLLSLATGTGGAAGLVLDTSVTDADVTASGGAVGSFTYQPGLAQRLTQLVRLETTSGTGILATAKTGRDARVSDLQKQIDAWDTRLSAYRATLQTQFTAMETAIAALKSQTSALTQLTTSSTSTN
jgi:flagellar hook-associated protein 2